jgi:RHS repeat-associated protein
VTGLPALKQFDLVAGIDVHLTILPGPPPFVAPLPNPFVGFFFDPQAFVPSNASVRVQGLPRACAGSAVKAMPPHLPLAGPFFKPPANDGELFMGSSTVGADGSPLGYGGMPVLTCTDFGTPAPVRPGKSTRPSLYLPKSFAIPIPHGAPVLVGGTPTITLGTLQKVLEPLPKNLRALFAKSRGARGIQRKLKGASRYLNQKADRVFEKLGLTKFEELRKDVSHIICTATGHPVDVATGKVFTELVDYTLPGPLPFALERVWMSCSRYDGPLGRGWHASFDVALAVADGVVGLRLGDGRMVLFPDVDQHFHVRERLTLTRLERGYRVHQADSGETWHFEHRQSDVWPRTRIEDRDGSQVEFRHEGGRLRAIVDAGGRTWTLHYTGSRIRALEGPHPNTDERVIYRRWTYDDDLLVESHDALGQTQQFAYQRDLLVRETLPSGLSFHFEYDAQERCTRTWGDGGLYDHKLHYDPNFRRTTVTNSLGHKTVYEHDGAMVLRKVDALGNETRTELDDHYRVTATVDELGQRTEHTYDARGNLVRTELPDGAITEVEYADDLPTRGVDAIGGVWTCSYDARGREVTRVDPLGREVQREYGARGLRAIIEGGHTTLERDEHGEIVRLMAPNAGVTHFERDQLGRVIATTDARGARQALTLDLLGRAIEVHEPDGNVRTCAYDADDHLVHMQDANSEVHLRYAGMGQLAERREAGHSVRFHYDTEEQLTSLTNEHGFTYRFELGPSGHLDVERGFDGLTRRYLRDRAGRIVRIERPADRWTQYERDPLGRALTIEHFDGTSEHYRYRADGALTSARNDDCTLELERDPLGCILRESRGKLWVASEYDAAGDRVRMTSSYGIDQRIERDLLGDVLQVQEHTSGFHARFQRDALGNELLREVGAVRARWTYDRAGRPATHEIEGPTGTLRAVGYQWSPNDRLHTLIDSTRGPTRYHHDTRGYLAAAEYPDGTRELRMPDAVGNLFRTETRTDRKYGPSGELLWMRDDRGETHFTYDLEGNLLTKREPDGGTWHYAWNGAGRLREVTRPDGTAVTFQYDAFARRIAKSYRGETTRWVWDGDVPLHEWVESEQHSHIAWLFDPETFSLTACVRSTHAESVLCDHLGSPLGIEASHSFPRPFRYPGQYADSETGLFYNRHRYFDPCTSYYTSRDPFGLAGGINLFAYVDDPLAWIDPLGLSCSPHRTKPRIEDGNLREGWVHIVARHVTGDHAHGPGDLFPASIERSELGSLAEYLVAKGTRSTQPSKALQGFEKRVKLRGKRMRVRVVVDPHDANRVITMFPVKST